MAPKSRTFFFNDTATTEIYTLSLHDALPIFVTVRPAVRVRVHLPWVGREAVGAEIDLLAVVQAVPVRVRSEEHTSELQSRLHLVCRLLLEKKNSRVFIFTLRGHSMTAAPLAE